MSSVEHEEEKPTVEEKKDYGSVEVTESEEKSDKSTIETELSLEELLQGMGVGRAQYAVWFLLACLALSHNTTYFLVTILIPYLRCEWELDTTLETTIGSSAAFCFFLGGVFLSFLADEYGRKKVLLATCAVLILSSVLSATAPNGYVFLFARILQGLGNGAGKHVCFVFAAEIVSSQNKDAAVFVISLACQFGGVFLSSMCYIFLNMIGWRYLIFILITPLVVSMIGLTQVPESSRYLLVSGRKEDALDCLKKLYSWNTATFPKKCTDIKTVATASNVKGGKLKMTELFRHGYAKTTCILTIMYFANYHICMVFAAYIPLKNESMASRLRKECDYSLDQDALIEDMMSFVGDILGTFTCALAGRVLGRRLVLRGYAALTLLSSSSVYFGIGQIFRDILAMMLRCSATGFRYTTWLVALEMYPTVLRSTASGFATSCGQMGGGLGSLLAYCMYPISPVIVVSLIVGFAGIQLIVAFIWNKESKDNLLADNMEQPQK